MRLSSRDLLATLSQGWWQLVLVVLSLLIVIALLRLTVQLFNLARDMRQAGQASADRTDSEETAANAAFFRMRRQTIVRSMLFLLLILLFVAYPVVNFWYGLE